MLGSTAFHCVAIARLELSMLGRLVLNSQDPPASVFQVQRLKLYTMTVQPAFKNLLQFYVIFLTVQLFRGRVRILGHACLRHCLVSKETEKGKRIHTFLV